MPIAQLRPVAIIAAAALLSPAALHPQAVPAGPAVQLAPLRVTADLWEPPLERVPASVSIYDGAALRDGVRHFGDLVDQIPNLTWTGGTSRPRYLQIRGVGENSQYEGETPDSAVRFLIDDLDFTGLGGVASTFDVDQVEVLRGPQAGAFGPNAAGGLVRLVTAAPTPFFTGRIEGTFGGDGLREAGIAVGGPLVAAGDARTLMGRLALNRHVSDGFRRNLTAGRDTNSRDERSARLRLAGQPAGGWRWEAALLHADQRNGFDEFALDNNGRFTYSDRPGRDEQKSLAGSLRGEGMIRPALRLTTIVSALRAKSRYSYDDDWTAASYAGFSDLGRERRGLNAEVRLDGGAPGTVAVDRLRWTLGAHAARLDEDSRYTNEDPGNLRGLATDYASRQLSLFSQAGLSLAGAGRLVAGLRLERVAQDGTGVRTRFRKTRGTFDPVVTFRPRFSDTLPGGKLSWEHDLPAHGLLFASVTRGYKAGGVNVDARINPPADPLTYRTETLWNWEAGVRGQALERRLTGGLTGFLLQRSRTQVRDSAGFGGNYRFFTANGRGARVAGLEATAAFSITRELSLYSSAALMDSELERFTLANGNAGGGRALANTPRHGYTAGLRYEASGGFFARIEQTGRAAQFDSNNHDEARRAFRVVNAAAGFGRGGWSCSVWARNLLDSRHDKRVFFFGNAEPDYAETRYESRADPRQVGVTLARRF
jgi:iron complex outermembrane receptor protein